MARHDGGVQGPLFGPNLLEKREHLSPQRPTRVLAPSIKLPQELLTELVICADQNLTQLDVSDFFLSPPGQEKPGKDRFFVRRWGSVARVRRADLSARNNGLTGTLARQRIPSQSASPSGPKSPPGEQTLLRPNGINIEKPVDAKSEHDERMPSHVPGQSKKIVETSRPMVGKASTGIKAIFSGVLHQHVEKLPDGRVESLVGPRPGRPPPNVDLDGAERGHHAVPKSRKYVCRIAIEANTEGIHPF